MAAQQGMHDVVLSHHKNQLVGGDLLFLVSCSEIISTIDRQKYSTALVLHASDLPNGRGWSPHIWEIVNGADAITLTLLEAGEKVDSGKIWNKIRIPISRHALWYEINQLLFRAEIKMIDYAVENFQNITPVLQETVDVVNYFRKRTPFDSRIDVNKSIAEQFDLIRVSDPNRFPAYFEYLGVSYTLKIEKIYDK
jgi:methionyl-tRNA formyltransferase